MAGCECPLTANPGTGIKFTDPQLDLLRKVPQKPAEIDDDDRGGLVPRHFPRFTLGVIYSNIVNHVLRVYGPGARFLASGRWR